MENTQLSKPHEQEDKKNTIMLYLFKSVFLMLILGYMVYNRV